MIHLLNITMEQSQQILDQEEKIKIMLETNTPRDLAIALISIQRLICKENNNQT